VNKIWIAFSVFSLKLLVYIVSQKTVHFCFCHYFVKFPPILINFGRYMAKWLKLYAVYTFSTKHDPCHCTTLLHTDVLNFYLTLDLLFCYNQIAQIWCQSEEGILSRQLSCSEVTARHAQVVRRRFSMLQQDGAQAHQHATPSLSWSKRAVRNASSSKRLCPCTGHIPSKKSDNFAPICHDN